MTGALLLIALCAGGWGLVRFGTRWGSTPEERARDMPGDEYLVPGSPARAAMTRAISIDAPPEQVWPWLAQLGRGAGWYSVDWLDNGRRVSARHIVSWIPEPAPGDATAIGYLRYIEYARSLVWWVDGVQFVGARARLATCIDLHQEGRGARLVIRMSADATGPMAPLALGVFRVIDSIMAIRQLLGIRQRVEVYQERRAGPRELETGARDQFQACEVIYASGETAGIPGREPAARWREAAIADGVLRAAPGTPG